MSLVGAVVMAAGAGRRMGYRPKSLLRRDGVPLVERVLRTLLDNGVAPVVVVLGHHATAIEPVLRTVQGTLPDPRALQWALNPAPDEGQGSSLRTGLAALPPDLDAVLVALADQPLLAQADVAAVLAAWAAHPPGIDLLVPQFDGQPGHPIVFGRAVRQLIEREQRHDDACCLRAHRAHITVGFHVEGNRFLTLDSRKAGA